MRIARGYALILMLVAIAGGANRSHSQNTNDHHTTGTYEAMLWPSQPPADNPFEPSEHYAGLVFTGRHAEYTGGDTWYMAWAADGNLYSTWTDGKVGELTASSGGEKANTGYATVSGDDPLNLKITNEGLITVPPAPYGGRYPSTSLYYKGVWYYGTFSLDELGSYNWGTCGPFIGFHTSRDQGKTWQAPPRTPAEPLFGENAKLGNYLKFGFAHFVDFGQELAHSPDGKAYLVSHGAVKPDADPKECNLSWITGDQVYLSRAEPSFENLNDGSQYEFYCGKDADGKDVWSRDMAKIKPIAEWNNNMGCVNITYNAPLKKYLMCITDGRMTFSQFNTYVLEADSLTGPWRLITYMYYFGEQAYSVQIPSKFISADGNTFWLSYSANYSNWGSGYKGRYILSKPEGSRYALCLQEVRLPKVGENISELLHGLRYPEPAQAGN